MALDLDENKTYFDPVVDVSAALNPNSLQNTLASSMVHCSSHTGFPPTNTFPDL